MTTREQFEFTEEYAGHLHDYLATFLGPGSLIGPEGYVNHQRRFFRQHGELVIPIRPQIHYPDILGHPLRLAEPNEEPLTGPIRWYSWLTWSQPAAERSPINSDSGSEPESEDDPESESESDSDESVVDPEPEVEEDL